MTRTEERLTDALAARAAAVPADSIRPLPAPGFGSFRRHQVTRRWSASLAPLATAASIAALTAVMATLPHHHDHRSAAGLPPNSELLGVAATSASSAWAVGATLGRRGQALVMRWDGTSWTHSPIARPAKGSALRAVAALSARDAWAVGSVGPGTEMRPYILHWDGTAWRRVPVPKMSESAQLTGVAVVSARDAWAVGGPHGALILHWNGITWLTVPSRWSAGHGWLFGVFARSASDVWAVGTAGFNSLILHWNGVTWTRLGGPRFGRYGSNIVGVDAVSPRQTWLVGETRSGLPLILRWNGAGLRQLARPPPPAGGGLASVSAVSASQAWAVGTGGSRHQPSRSWIMRWQGHGWRSVPGPRQIANATLRSVAAVSANNVWAVGYSGLGANIKALIWHWNGLTWRVAG